MAPGCKPLSPDIRLLQCQESLQRYTEKNAEALCAAARLRMQRQVFPSADYKTRVKYAMNTCEASANYWFKKAEEERAADTLLRLLRKKGSLKSKTKPRKLCPALQAKTKCGSQREAHHKPLPAAAPKLKHHQGRSRWNEQEHGDNFSNNSGREHRCHRRSESPIILGLIKSPNAAPACCPECGEDGCPSCASTPTPLLCTPEFSPDPGHKDKVAHSASKNGQIMIGEQTGIGSNGTFEKARDGQDSHQLHKRRNGTWQKKLNWERREEEPER
ncbi:hypothetical protein B0H19DRAFT_1064924 [Mycena capillaripes]|nr:hypothetical protein B0H19DRAFT_1064924 [Mycena capillaripes]